MNETIINQAQNNGGMVTSAWMHRKGIPSVYMSRLVADGRFLRIARGIYVNESDPVPDPWYILQSRNPTCVFSFTSALYLLGETDLIPHLPEVTVYSGYNAKHLKGQVIVHYVKKEFHQLGVIETKTNLGFSVCAYDFERTVCDLLVNRNKVDSELFASTMQRYAKSPTRQISKLMGYAEIMGVKDLARFVMELLQ